MKKILIQTGVKCKSKKDEMKLYGLKKINNKNKIIKVPNLSDHRICMSAAILALVTGIKTKLKILKQQSIFSFFS